MKKNVLIVFSLLLLFNVADAQITCNNNTSQNCKWNNAKNCWGLAQFNAICPSYKIPYPFYSSFTDSLGLINRPFANNCQPWKFLMYQSNCCDNPNFNFNSTCINDTTSPYPSWKLNPRMKVAGTGRLQGKDTRLEIFSYPGDHAQTGIYNCRSEASIAPEIADGDTRYYSWSFKFPSDWVDDENAGCPNYVYNHYFLLQVHTFGGTAHNCADQTPVFIFNYSYNKNTNKRIIKVLYGCHCNGVTPLIGTFPVVLGKWYDFIASIKWTTDPDMSQQTLKLQAFKDLTPLPDIFGYGPNLYKDVADTNKIIYHKFQFGLYRGSYNCTVQKIYFDEFSMAANYNELKSIHVDSSLFFNDNKLEGKYFPVNENDDYRVGYDHQLNQIYLNVPEEEVEKHMILKIYDTLGRQVASYNLSGSRQYELNRFNNKNGIYFYTVLNEKGNRLSQGKFMLF